MAKELRMSLACVIGCFCASALSAKAEYMFDLNRFFVHKDANAANGISAKVPASLEFELDKSEDAVATKTANAPKPNTNRFSLYLSARTSTNDGAHPAQKDQANKTVSVQFAIDSGVAPPPPCGPSTASVEEIKALVAANADRYGVDPDFALAVTWTESKFDRARNSQKGARGPMQLMPATARRFAVKDVCNPAENIAGGVRYLRALLDEFKSPLFAAAAYNAGERAIYENGGIPPFPETVRYVASVFNYQFGLNLPIKRQKRDGSRETDETSIASDVMGARPSKFVGGVMQF
jgi:hypothetical protein